MDREMMQKLSSFSTASRTYARDEAVFHAGDKTHSLGIVKSGSVQIEQTDFWGNRTVIDKLGPGGFFAETYAITNESLMVDVIAAEESEIAFVDVALVMNGTNMEEKMSLVSMLMKISAQKNLNFSRRIMFTSPKSIRERLTAFLSYQSQLHQAKEFDIPFDRQALSDYLNVERSALSKELGRMKDEGLLETRKSHFRLLK